VQTDDYTLEQDDAIKTIQISMETTAFVTVPKNQTISIGIGSVFNIDNICDENVIVMLDSGVVLRSRDGANIIPPYSSARLKKIGEDEWLLTGDLSGSTPKFTCTSTGVLSIITRGPADTGMWVNWGDGSDLEWIAHVGISTDVTTNHDYDGSPGTKEIAFTGLLEQITKFRVTDPEFGGSMQAVAAFAGLTYLNLAFTAIEGSLEDISGLTSLEVVYLYNIDGLVGDLEALVPLTNITHLYLYSTGIQGDVSELYCLSSMRDFRVNSLGASIVGNVGSLSAWEELTCLYVQYTSASYVTAVLPVWDGILWRFQGCALTELEVDSVLIDLASSGSVNGNLNISGDNAARSSASDSALATLLANGWTVTVNE